MGGKARNAILFAVSCMLAAATAHAQDTTASRTPDWVLGAIMSCLSEGLGEVLMAPTVQCVERTKGSKLAKQEGMPLHVDPESVCQNKDDPRVLPGDVVKRIAADPKRRVAPSGIRIIGAVFCEKLDLVGLDLSYSLVLDRSLFVKGINARNFSLRGDFSIDAAVLLNSLILTRAKVDGSVYSGGAFLDNLILSETNIAGSLHLARSLLLRDARLYRISLSGDLTIKDSALSFFLLQSSRVGGALDLSDSEVRCGYHIKANNIGYALAENAGFGVFRSKATDGAPSTADYAWWRRRLEDSLIRELLDSPATKKRAGRAIAKIADKPPSEQVRGCEESTASKYAEFYFFDNRIQSTFCLRSFEWLAPERTPQPSLPVSIVALNGTNVTGNLIVDLWPHKTIHDGVEKDKHKLEEVGVSAGSLIFDFADTERPYFTYLDGLSFDRVHTAGSTCEYQRSTSEDEGPITIGGSNSQTEPPGVGDIERWLEKTRHAPHNRTPHLLQRWSVPASTPRNCACAARRSN